MKIKDFTIFPGNARLTINSSSIRLESVQIQGSVQCERCYPDPEKEKCSFIFLKMSARIVDKDKDSLRELKGLINQADF